MFLALFALYLVLLMGLGWWARRRAAASPEEYFVAGRSFGPLVLFFSMAATNFSAFFFLGFAGQAYRYGYGMYGIMGFGTAFMAIMFYVLGRQIRALGKERGYLTPAELVGDRLGSRAVQLTFMAVMVLFTIPYLATQAVGAGIIIAQASGLDFRAAASLIMLVITVYVLLGGMRGVGWTDVAQGALMFGAMLLATLFVARGLGGLSEAGSAVYAQNPDLFTRPGPEGYFTVQLWLSFLLLWLFVDPMFPQLFMRFYTAKDARSLKWTMVLYPLLVSVLFLCPVMIGVWGTVSGYQGPPDGILPHMVQTYAPAPVFTLVMLGALGALMSTADSQLLALATMLARDLLPRRWQARVVPISKTLVIALVLFALSFIFLGYDPQVGIMDTLVKTTFSGLIVLFPTVFAAVYWPRATGAGALASIATGELAVALFQQGILPTFGLLDGILALGIAALVLVGVSLLSRRGFGPT